MKRTITVRINYWLMRTIYVQLYLSLMSSPILIYWGLPVSIASPVGNILFNPLLVVFLFFSSLLFFTELLHIPNSLCAHILNYCTQCMDYSARWGSREWLIGFAKPMFILLLLIPIATLLVIHYRYNRKSWRGVFALFMVSIAISVGLMHTTVPKKIQAISCNKGSLALIACQSKTIVLDPGYLGSLPSSSSSFVQYTLVPTIIKNAGTMTIDALIILKVTMTTLAAIATMAQFMTIHTIYFPKLQGSMMGKDEEKWNNFKRILDEHNIELVSIEYPFSIQQEQEKFTITPMNKKISYHSLFYNAITVACSLDGAKNIWATIDGKRNIAT